jgi:hypothetical protein
VARTDFRASILTSGLKGVELRNCIVTHPSMDCSLSFTCEGRPINAYVVLDEGNLEAGDRALEAPEMLQVGCKESSVKTLFGLYRP